MGSYQRIGVYPDLPIPQYRVRGLSRITGDQLFRRGRRSDLRGQCLPAGAVAGSAVVAVASLGMTSSWQHVAATGAGVLGLYSAASLLSRTAVERRQREFEREWLAKQTAALRQHPFEVLRCTVRGRQYNMAAPADVRDLREQPGNERTSVAFTYFAGGRRPTVGEVHRRLREVTFVPDVAAPGRAFVRFPQARYLPRPRREGRPARRTSWTLDGPVLLSVSAIAAGASAASGA